MTSAPATVGSLLAQATERLRASSTTPRLDAELLLAHALEWPRARLLAERLHTPDGQQIAAFKQLVARREQFEPVAYLVGHKEFYGLDLVVDRRVLVPRPETEQLVDLALDWMRRKRDSADLRPSSFVFGSSIADIGTGSGAIAIALAVQLPEAQVWAVDLSSEALAVAAENVARHGVGGRMHLVAGDLLEPLVGPFDLIVSNPPYTILAEVDEGVRRHEPHLALDGGSEGLEVYRRLLAQAPAKLAPGGALLLEIGAWQGQAIITLAHQHFPTAQVTLHTDLAGRDRVVEINLPKD